MIKPASMPDAFDREAFERAVAEGVAAADAGRLVPHDVVRQWLVDLAEGEDATPPSLDPAASGS
jgi:predicted transcriptional regulator